VVSSCLTGGKRALSRHQQACAGRSARRSMEAPCSETVSKMKEGEDCERLVDSELHEEFVRVLSGEIRSEDTDLPTQTQSMEAGYFRMIQKLRSLIVRYGLPQSANDRDFDVMQHGAGQENSGFRSVCSLRGLVWKALLGLAPSGSIRVNEYFALVERGASKDAEKIGIDVVRTFNSNAEFVERAPPAALARVLNAYCHAHQNVKGCYVQSMSLLLAPFMLVMPEVDAYFAFSKFVDTQAPRYVRGQYAGVHDAFRLLESALKQTDSALYAHLAEAHELSPELYAFSIVSTLNACVPPLQDTVKLWDIIVAFGAHWGGVLFTLARLVNSSALLQDDAGRINSGMRGKPLFTRDLEAGLDMTADATICSAARITAQLSPELRRAILQHPIVPVSEPPS